jgi:hypothetical protein
MSISSVNGDRRGNCPIWGPKDGEFFSVEWGWSESSSERGLGMIKYPSLNLHPDILNHVVSPNIRLRQDTIQLLYLIFYFAH